MATAQIKPQREVIEFPPNTPVHLALKYNQGKVISGQYGERVMLTTTDNRVAFLDLEVAGQIESAGINVRESFTLTKRWDGQKGAPVTWEVARVAGEQPNGTLVVPALPESKPPQRAETAHGGLVDDAKALIDAYALVLGHALTTHEGRVKPDEVRAIFLTAVINRNRAA